MTRSELSFEAVDAIEAQVKREAGDGGGGFLLGVEHGEGNARGFVAEPLGDEIE